MRQDLKYMACVFLGAATAAGWWLLAEIRAPEYAWGTTLIRGAVATSTVLVGAWVFVTVFEWMRRKP